MVPTANPLLDDPRSADSLSASDVQALQLERLHWTLAHAYANVPHYRDAFDDAGLVPSDIESLDDIRRLPFTTKADLRETYPFGMFAVPLRDVRRIHASS